MLNVNHNLKSKFTLKKKYQIDKQEIHFRSLKVKRHILALL